MATDLLLPDGLAPSNLHLRPSVKVRYVDGDMFSICEQLSDIDPRLYIVELAEDAKANYMIMESCDDGVQRAVIPKGVKELDGRVLEKVRYLMHVPFEHRLAAAEADADRWEADSQEAELDRIYEKMGGEFRYQLWHDGFIEHRDISYPKVGVASPGRRR